MDLNKTAPAPEPAPGLAVKVMRLPRGVKGAHTDSGPRVFSGGEALPESQGIDLPHPISAEERDALIQAGYSPEDIDEIAANHSQLLEAMLEELPEGQIIGAVGVDKGFTNEPRDEMDIDLSHLDPVARAGAEFTREVIRDLQRREREPQGPPEGHTRHVCIVTPCSWYLDVPPIEDDVMSLLGGVSPKVLEQAQEVEMLMFSHLAEHTIVDWAKALKAAQSSAPTPGRITTGYAEAGITPGPAQRDPARAAAVAAMDARLGRSAPAPAAPADAAAHDDMLRERRRLARERAKIPSAYELTPKWSSELGDGVVGIKR